MTEGHLALDVRLNLLALALALVLVLVLALVLLVVLVLLAELVFQDSPLVLIRLGCFPKNITSCHRRWDRSLLAELSDNR